MSPQLFFLQWETEALAAGNPGVKDVKESGGFRVPPVALGALLSES